VVEFGVPRVMDRRVRSCLQAIVEFDSVSRRCMMVDAVSENLVVHAMEVGRASNEGSSQAGLRCSGLKARCIVQYHL